MNFIKAFTILFVFLFLTGGAVAQTTRLQPGSQATLNQSGEPNLFEAPQDQPPANPAVNYDCKSDPLGFKQCAGDQACGYIQMFRGRPSWAWSQSVCEWINTPVWQNEQRWIMEGRREIGKYLRGDTLRVAGSQSTTPQTAFQNPSGFIEEIGKFRMNGNNMHVTIKLNPFVAAGRGVSPELLGYAQVITNDHPQQARAGSAHWLPQGPVLFVIPENGIPGLDPSKYWTLEISLLKPVGYIVSSHGDVIPLAIQ